MNKFLLPAIFSVAMFGHAAIAQSTTHSPTTTTKPETPVLHKDDYRQKLDEVIVIGQDPYWRKQGAPRWDRSKVDVELKPKSESRLQMFPNYAAEERDEALKPHDSNRNNSEPKIKVFDAKF
jgi:hypothetical protein